VNNDRSNESKFAHNLDGMKEFLSEITNAIQEEKETQKNIDIQLLIDSLRK